MQRPDVLVLGAGGTIGAAWMGGVLAGLSAETGIDFAACEHIVGTSAGSMVAADLLAGVEPRAAGPAGAGAPAEGDAGSAVPGEALGTERDGDRDTAVLSEALGPDRDGDNGTTVPSGAGDPLDPGDGNGNGRLRDRAGRFGAGVAAVAGSSLAPLALSLGRAPGTLVRAAALARIDPPQRTLDDLGARIARHGLEFDGRLRIACVERARGRRVVFGAPGAPAATVAQAVQASCSIPWVYAPLRIGDDEYVDGAVWSPTNMDAAPAGRETHLLCLAPMAGPLGARERHPAVRAATTAAIRLETLALRRRGAIVTVLAPEPTGPDEHARTTGYRHGRKLAQV